MATTGTNNTVKWELSNNTLTISPLSGGSGIAKGSQHLGRSLTYFISLTDTEWESIESLVFNGDVSFYYQDNVAIMEPPTYSPLDDYRFFFPFSKMKNLASIDVTGLNTTGAINMHSMFSSTAEPQITAIIGLNTLDTSQCEDFGAMFIDLPLSSVDISSFSMSQTANIFAMFNRMKYCQRIILPQNFSRKDTGMDDERYKYFLGITSSGTIPITKDGVTVTNDEDFFKLTSITQGGTWERDLSGVATLSFKVTSSVREGNEATLSFKYLTTSATARVYLKKSIDSSFPSSPIQTISLDGTGSSSTVLQLATDDAYDVMIIVDDGETTLYTYPSIDSNMLLLQIDEEGNVEASGNITDGGGNVLSDKADTTDLADYLPLAGGTLTGALNGTDINASGNIHAQGMAGMIQMFAGATAPNGWLICDGQAVSRTTYDTLFDVIGTTYGAGDGSTTFNLPDMRDRFPVGAGADYVLNGKGGAATVTLNTNQMPSHVHGVGSNKRFPVVNSYRTLTPTSKRAYTATNANGVAYIVSTSTEGIEHWENMLSQGGGQAHENMPPYIGINYIICTGK